MYNYYNYFEPCTWLWQGTVFTASICTTTIITSNLAHGYMTRNCSYDFQHFIPRFNQTSLLYGSHSKWGYGVKRGPKTGWSQDDFKENSNTHQKFRWLIGGPACWYTSFFNFVEHANHTSSSLSYPCASRSWRPSTDTYTLEWAWINDPQRDTLVCLCAILFGFRLGPFFSTTSNFDSWLVNMSRLQTLHTVSSCEPRMNPWIYIKHNGMQMQRMKIPQF
jgi:hypothetical protein